MKFVLLFKSCLLGALLFLGGSLASFAAGPLVTYKGLHDDAHIAGPKLTENAFKGKVVLWEYWGINCPPCIASLPHLQEIYEKYGERGKLLVVASHFQGQSPRINEFLKSRNYTFPVYQSARLEGIPMPKALPFTVLIGADGRVVKAGSPASVFDEVKKEVRKVPNKALLFPEFKATRYKGIYTSLVAGGNNLDAKIAPLRSKQDKEAVELCKLFDEWSQQEIQALKALADSDSFESVPAYENLKKSLPEAVKPFAEKIEAMKKDRAFIALTALSKKVDALEERKGRGKKVAASAVESLQPRLAPYLQDSRSHVKAYASDIQARLQALQGNAQ